MAEGCVVVGGPCDGEWRIVPRRDLVVERFDPNASILGNVPMSVTRFRYVRFDLAAGEKMLDCILAPEGWTLEQVLRALCEGYRRPLVKDT